MKLSHNESSIYLTHPMKEEDALARTSHLGIGAHQDDLEIMASHGIVSCFDQSNKWFSGIICTDGGGSARSGKYSHFSDQQMKDIRIKEQQHAARNGDYSATIQLGYESAQIKDGDRTLLIEDLKRLLTSCKPQIVYTHNLADKHPTHQAVVICTIEAIRQLPTSERPQQLLGCEVWRDLDWMLDQDKIALNVSGNEKLIGSLINVFDSQIGGGKRYDLATIGRMRANATYHQSHDTDKTSLLSYAMDLTPLIKDEKQSIIDYVGSYIDRLKQELSSNLSNIIEK